MAWRKPTTDDLAQTLSRKELESYAKSSALDGADPVDALITASANLIRGYIRANASVVMSTAAASIPESLVAPCMDYAAYQVLKRQPLPVAEARRKAYEDALAIFEKVASGKLTPESCTDSTAATGSSMPLPSFAEPVPHRVLD